MTWRYPDAVFQAISEGGQVVAGWLVAGQISLDGFEVSLSGLPREAPTTKWRSPAWRAARAGVVTNLCCGLRTPMSCSPWSPAAASPGRAHLLRQSFVPAIRVPRSGAARAQGAPAGELVAPAVRAAPEHHWPDLWSDRPSCQRRYPRGGERSRPADCGACGPPSLGSCSSPDRTSWTAASSTGPTSGRTNPPMCSSRRSL